MRCEEPGPADRSLGHPGFLARGSTRPPTPAHRHPMTGEPQARKPPPIRSRRVSPGNPGNPPPGDSSVPIPSLARLQGLHR